MTASIALRVDRNPIRMGGSNIVVSSMGIGPSDKDHAELSATFHQLAKRIGIPKPLATVVKGNFRGIKSDAAAAAEANGIRAGAFKIIEPELEIELTGIIFDKSQLRPAHGFVDPRWRRRGERVL